MDELLKLATQIVGTLKEKDLFITTVESCTGGGISNCITNISGASEVMMGARVTYSNEEKIALGIPEEIIEKYTVYSVETAIAMAAAGVRQAFRADIGVGVTGSISRVDPANPGSKPGEVYIAVVFGDKIISKKFLFSDAGERWEVKNSAIKEALKFLIDEGVFFNSVSNNGNGFFIAAKCAT